VWVSFFLDEIISLRDQDWSELAQSYTIPENVETIDKTKAVLRTNGNVKFSTESETAINQFAFQLI